MFGELIHELTGPLVPTVLPGVHGVHAVDAAGVHPLLLAIGSERYVPYAKERRPMELLTQANAILGQGQMSLAKYLFITTKDDAPGLRMEDVGGFLGSVLSRFDPTRDVHFQTNTTIDTLDYSGSGLNQGSKVVVCATGPSRRTLAREVPSSLSLPSGFGDPHVGLPGVLVLRAPPHGEGNVDALLESLRGVDGFPLVVLTEDSAFAARNVNNLVWVTFTRSNPAVDIRGVDEFVVNKGWGCRGAVVIDARIKPHHAPPLVEDPEVTKRVDRLGVRGASLHGII